MLDVIPDNHSNCDIERSNWWSPHDAETLEGIEEVEAEDGEVAEVVDDVLIGCCDGLLVLMEDEADAVADHHAGQECEEHQWIFHVDLWWDLKQLKCVYMFPLYKYSLSVSLSLHY